jgi:hypothetical protein
MFLSLLPNLLRQRNRGAKRRFGSTRLSLESLEGRNLLTPASLSVATQFVNSNEHFGDVITFDYQQYLARNPDAGGFNHWLSELQNGVAPEAVLAAIVGSSEYFANHGGNTTTGFVPALYHDILHRTASASEVNAWMAAISAGMPIGQVAFDFTTSDERRIIVINTGYQLFLDRSPESTATVQSWVNMFHQGMNEFGFEILLVGSDEYFQTATSPNSPFQPGTNGNFVILVYEDVLGRDPSQAEFNAWLNFMDHFQG